MTQTLAKYQSRYQRYILQPDDNTLIRVAGPHQTPWEEATEIQNISLTGLAFTAPAELCPLIGEIVKIQFEVPGSAQTACLALVTRLDRIGTSTVLAAVEFRRLEMSQRVIIAQSLARKLREQLQQHQVLHHKSTLQIVKAKWKLFGLASLFLAIWAGVFYVFSTIFSNN